TVAPSTIRGGENTARKRMKQFFEIGFPHYGTQRNEPEKAGQSGLSPYLHFGFISTHEIFAEIAKREKWTPAKPAVRAHGSREGWWNMSANAEGFLDELITWREVGFNFAVHRKDIDEYESLPEWAKKTLREHTRDEREHTYTLKEFEEGRTHDQLWNA